MQCPPALWSLFLVRVFYLATGRLHDMNHDLPVAGTETRSLWFPLVASWYQGKTFRTRELLFPLSNQLEPSESYCH